MLLTCVQGIATAPIIFALQEEPEMVNLIERKFGQKDDDRLVQLKTILLSLCKQ